MANNQTFTFNIKAVANMNDVLTNINNIQTALNKLKLPDSMKASFDKTFKNLIKEVENYQTILNKPNKTKGDITGLEKSSAKIITLYDQIVSKIKSIDNSTLKNAFKDLGTEQVKELKEQIASLQTNLTNLTKNSDFAKGLKSGFEQLKQDTKGASTEVQALIKKLESSTFGKTLFKNIDIGRLDLVKNNINSIKQQIEEFKQTTNQEPPEALMNWLTNLENKFNELNENKAIQEIVTKLNEFKQNLSGKEANIVEGLIKGFKDGIFVLDEFGKVMINNTKATNDAEKAQQQYNSELDQVKSRIKYIFGLNNAINLVRRTMRDAFNTIKDLDKAMTETAVVTDFTVGDMWAQLPEYTKRANQLGVSTLEAYQAATLYYQQGLNTEQVNALSNETLKMARIAGLDAADATDRMTNALRGFNMEINAINAERIDDVYSKLAAMSASNVDEISTAMTKVASLAHNANMEFETTAAFLAQIIETTRESPETAGTALKTVAARFSEVKKLISQDQLIGQDEEGQKINVNKVQQALATADIDLGKYFAGEVGLDDIFMELASKWDSLTSIQQRYIATQAAGSRQQSRFIAMVQDYARTQELVSAAYNANGASAKQFEKTQDSLQSKLAKLKNAWNEFSMGILNSDLVKGLVDAGTIILNIINSITSGFGSLNEGIGSVINSLFKLGSLFGTLKLGKLFLGGGGAGSLLGNLTGLATKKGNTELAKQIVTAIGGDTAKVTGAGGEASLVGGILPKFIKGLGGGLGGLFTGAGFKAGAAAGVAKTGLAALGPWALGIAAIGTAAVVATKAVKTLYNLSPKGQLENAKKFVKALNSAADAAEKSAKEIKEIQEKSFSYDEAVANTSTTEERAQAIKDRNEYITSLLEQNAAYAKYVKTTFENGEIVLTLDSDALADAVETIANNAIKARGYSYLGEGDLAYQQIQYLKSQRKSYANPETGEYGILELGVTPTSIYEIDFSSYLQENYEKPDELDDDERGEAWKQWQNQNQKFIDKNYLKDEYGNYYLKQEKYSDEDYAKALISQQEEEQYKQQLQSYTQLGLQKLLSTNYSDEIAYGLSKILANTFNYETIQNSEMYQGALKNLRDKNEDLLENQYKEKFQTQEIPEYLKNNKEELAKTIAFYEVTDNFIESVAGASGKLSNFNPKTLDSLMNLLNGEGFNQVSWNQYSNIINAPLGDFWEEFRRSEGLNSVFNILGLSSDDFNDFRDLFSSDIKREIAKTIQDNVRSQYKISNEKAKKIANATDYKTETYLPSGAYQGSQAAAIQNAQNKILDNLTPEQINSLSNLVDDFEKFNLDFNKDILDSFLVLPENILEVEQALSGINLDEPITAYQTLIKLTEDAENAASGYASTILEANKELFSSTALVASFLNSEDYDAISESLSNFIEANGEITPENIEELAKSCKSLDILLKEGIISAKGMAVALTGIENGTISVLDLNDSIIKALNSIDDLDSSIRKTLNTIKDFDPGYEEDEITGFISNTLELTKKKISEGKWGSEQMKNSLEFIFGEFEFDESSADDYATQYQNWVYKNIEWLEANKDNMKSAWTDILGDDGILELSGGAEIWEENGEILINTAGQSLEYVKESILQYAKDHNLNLTETMLNMMIGDYKSNSPDFEYMIDKANIDRMASVIRTEAEKIFPNLNILDNLLGTTDTSSLSVLKEYLYNVFKDLKGYHNEEGILNADALYGALDSAGYGRFYEEFLNKMAAEEGKFITRINGEQREITLQEGETATEAIQRVTEELKNTDESENKIEIDTNIPETQEQIQALQEALEALAAGDYSAIIKLGFALSDFQGTAATGGKVGSYAAGSQKHKLKPGAALTGEEAPEIVWNKEKGYAYITGINGPQFQNLQSGDQVFNGKETKKILDSSFTQKNLFGSKGKGDGDRFNNKRIEDEYTARAYEKHKSYSGESSDNKDTGSSKDWKNSLDWLYDLMEDIAEEEHKQTLIQSEYELAEKDLSKTGRDLYNLTKAELDTLQAQLSAQQFAFEKRLQQMNELQQKVVAEGFEEYLRWNPEDNSLEIDWDKINEITDKDTYDKLSELVSDMEKVQDQMDEAQEATLDIKKQIQELQIRYLQAYLDFQDKVMEAVVAQYQQNIDSLSELNDTINEANESILDSIQKEIDLQRQIRDNTDTEKEIADMEARLAMLQRDTAGANQQEILDLQKQLDEARKNYSDTLIDQAIDRLSQNNDDAQEQREKQIELLEAQLEYWQETGALWEEVAELIASGFTPQGSIIEDSTLWKVLKDKDSWDGLSQAQKEKWANELILESAQVGAYLTQLNGGVDISTDRIIDSIIGEHGLAGEITTETRIVRAQLNELIAKLGGTPIDSIPGEGGYASGGLATKTGLAMLHGTANEPEYVLNARQTGAFLRLADVLPSIFGSGTGTANNYGTNVYVELNMSVGEIGSDYDVDRLVARVKDDIYDASSYRNVNAVSFLR